MSVRGDCTAPSRRWQAPIVDDEHVKEKTMPLVRRGFNKLTLVSAAAFSLGASCAPRSAASSSDAGRHFFFI